MCQFKSAIVVRDESSKGGFRLLMSPWTESHSDLEAMHNLRDGARVQYAKVEFVPESPTASHLVESYKLQLDEERAPEWWGDDIRDAVAGKMATYIKSIIVTDNRKVLIGGQFIVCGDAKIGEIKTAVVQSICDSAKVNNICDSAKVNNICDSATVGYICDSAKVNNICDSATVGYIYGSAKVDNICDSAKVNNIYGSAKVGNIYDSAKIINDQRSKP